LFIIEPPFLAIRTCRRQSRLDRIIPDEIFVIAVLTSPEMSRCVPNVGLSTLIQFLADRFSQLLVNDAHFTLKCGVNRSMIGEL
jgi:hypothetical protein